NFAPVNGTAEATGLSEASVDLIVAGQAFHWFDKDATKPEFQRILKPGGYVALLWNIRKEDSSSFQIAYDELLRDFDTDGGSQAAKGTQHGGHGDLDHFFGVGQYELATFDNEQTFDFEGFCGRLLSASYMPLPGQPRYEALIEQAQAAFEAHQQNGRARLDYVTEVYWGQLN
ncbi:MAG TPA: methyltransferase domain-containing protein, partial [Phototrophicaceae bacterium]|nr:methyltransferase domain-containing protein [Phototrophicaceae bacterium]